MKLLSRWKIFKKLITIQSIILLITALLIGVISISDPYFGLGGPILFLMCFVYIYPIVFVSIFFNTILFSFLTVNFRTLKIINSLKRHHKLIYNIMMIVYLFFINSNHYTLCMC